MRIGEFGAAKRELSGEKDDFVFCGEVFTVERTLPAVLMLQLGASVSGKIDETEGFAAIWEALRVSLTIPEHDDVSEDDAPFRKLYGLAVDNGVDLEDMMKLVMVLFEAQTGRPTRQAPASLDGLPNTSPSLNTSSIPVAPSSHLRSVEDMLHNPATYGNVIQMGDGQMVEVDYDKKPQTEQIG